LATIRDVAKLADVSLGTVSKVINGVDSVRPNSLSASAAAMQALDYQPNHVARSLKSVEPKTIGVLVSDVVQPFFAGVMRGH